MQCTYNDNYVFNDTNGNKVLCHLTIYHSRKDDPAQTLVVATERTENPGQSITNCYERLADTVTAVHRLGPAHTLWVEHYNADSYSGKALEPNEADRYSLVQMSWNGERFSDARFAPLREQQLQGLIGSQVQQPDFDPALLTLAGVNTVATCYGLHVVSAHDEQFQYEPTIQQTGKEYVVVDADGTVLSPCKDLDSVSLFLTLWSQAHAPLETAPVDEASEVIALEQLNVIAARKGLRVVTSDTPGYKNHDWIVTYDCPYAVVNRYQTMISTARDLAVAETTVLLQADLDTDTEPLKV